MTRGVVCEDDQRRRSFAMHADTLNNTAGQANEAQQIRGEFAHIECAAIFRANAILRYAFRNHRYSRLLDRINQIALVDLPRVPPRGKSRSRLTNRASVVFVALKLFLA